MLKAPGRLAGRIFKSLAIARGDFDSAAAYAASQAWTESDQIAGLLGRKAAVGSLHRDNTSALFEAVGTDVAPLVTAASAVLRLPGFRRVPPMISLVTTSTGAVGYWADTHQSGGAAIPPSALSFSRFGGLVPARVAALSVVSNELARVSDAEQTIVGDLTRALSKAVDQAFLNPLNSGSPSVGPASATSSGRIFASGGSSLAQIDADLGLLIDALTDGGSDLMNATFILHPKSATYLSRLRGSGGSRAFPDISVKGGTVMGLPAIVTANITRAGSPSPGTSFCALVDASRCWLTSGDDVEVAASQHALIEMDSAPTQDASSGTGAQQVSTWQVESTALKLTRRINWEPVEGTGHSASLTNLEW
jgi:HK97 family phage major capsid protein